MQCCVSKKVDAQEKSIAHIRVHWKGKLFPPVLYFIFIFSCVCVCLCVCNNTIIWNHFQIKYKRLCVVHIYTKQSQMYLHDVRFEQKLSWKCVYTLFVCYMRWLKYSMFLFAYAVVGIENIILKKGKSINYVCVRVRVYKRWVIQKYYIYIISRAAPRNEVCSRH